ncbi:MAG: translation initiation factor IF-3, partial [Alphaproteobacteria bacterium]|nr:translation initiation factor IF-3 [Alphaproteobacteria bacterium]
MARRFYPNTPPAQSGPRVNERIETESVRLVDETGTNVGIVSLDDALGRAEEVGLDLVEIAPEAKPPVCKILDYGK